MRRRSDLSKGRTGCLNSGYLEWVDTGYFYSTEGRSQAPTIISTGTLDYFPRVDRVCNFSERTFPLVKHRISNAHFFIDGRCPCRSALRLSRYSGIGVIVDVLDVSPDMSGVHVAVVPLLLGRGIQNKILEAMAMNLPVVTSPQPAQGIIAHNGAELFVEDEPDALAERAVYLLKDFNLRTEVGQRARAFVENHHSWKQIGSDLQNLLEEVGK